MISKVTLKTAVMLKIQICHHRTKWHFTRYL